MKNPAHSGVTAIELLVVVAIITLLLAVGFPRVEDFAIRARVTEGLAVASAARAAVHTACADNPSAKIHDISEAGFHFVPTKYVAELLVIANCSEQLYWVGVVTRNTGAHPDPFLAYLTLPDHNSKGRALWKCRLIRGLEEHAPAECLTTIF